MFIYIYLSIQHVFSADYVSDTVMGARNTVRNKTLKKFLPSLELTFQWSETNKEQ